MRDALRTWLAGTPLSRVDAQDVVLAVWEACANAIEHAADPGGVSIQVHADVHDSRVRITVEDTGRWTPPTERADRGLGLRLIYASMSSVDVESRDEGTRVTFEKALGLAPETRLVRGPWLRLTSPRREALAGSSRPESARADRSCALEQPDQKQDDQDQRDEAATDVHAVSFRLNGFLIPTSGPRNACTHVCRLTEGA